VVNTFSTSDHSKIEFSLILSVGKHDNYPSSPAVYYDYEHADFDGIVSYLLNDSYRAMLCIRGTSHGPVSVSVCLSVCHKSEFY